MQLQFICTNGEVRLSGESAGLDVEVANRFLTHLAARAFPPARARLRVRPVEPSAVLHRPGVDADPGQRRRRR